MNSAVCRRPLRGVAGAALVTAVVAHASAQESRSQPTSVSVPTLVEAATAYVEEYEAQLSYLVAAETYTQHEQVSAFSARALLGPAASPGMNTVDTKRVMRGELFLTFEPSTHMWIAVRDIADVDGKPVANRQDLQTLLRGRSITSVGEQLKEHNARFNISRVERNFNEPTFALQVLERKNVSRFQFTRNAVTKAGDVALVTLRFDERDGPTLVVALTDHHPIYCSGEFVVEAGTGQVRRAVIR